MERKRAEISKEAPRNEREAKFLFCLSFTSRKGRKTDLQVLVVTEDGRKVWAELGKKKGNLCQTN